MSHPDPCYDSDNSCEDDMNYDDHDSFYGDYRDDLTHEELDAMWDEDSYEDGWDDDDYYASDAMDGDHDSAMESAGWGTDEDYGLFD